MSFLVGGNVRAGSLEYTHDAASGHAYANKQSWFQRGDSIRVVYQWADELVLVVG